LPPPKNSFIFVWRGASLQNVMHKVRSHNGNGEQLPNRIFSPSHNLYIKNLETLKQKIQL